MDILTTVAAIITIVIAFGFVAIAIKPVRLKGLIGYLNTIATKKDAHIRIIFVVLATALLTVVETVLNFS